MYISQLVWSWKDLSPKTPFTRYNWLSDRFDNRLYRVNKHPTGCQNPFDNRVERTALFVQPVVQPV